MLPTIYEERDYALSTEPLFKHVVQTWRRLGVPLTMHFTFFMLAFHMWLDLLWEWLTLFPKWRPFPQTSHFAMLLTSLFHTYFLYRIIYVNTRFFRNVVILTKEVMLCKAFFCLKDFKFIANDFEISYNRFVVYK